MIKCRIHIYSEIEFHDDNVYIDVELPCLPPKGSLLYLTAKHKNYLLKQAKKTLDIAAVYFPKWFYYGSQNCEKLRQVKLKDMSFVDAVIVNSVSFDTGEDFVRIELSDHQED